MLCMGKIAAFRCVWCSMAASPSSCPMPDWRIDGPQVHAVPGLVNLLGLESPGLTSCLAIGDYVAALPGVNPQA